MQDRPAGGINSEKAPFAHPHGGCFAVADSVSRTLLAADRAFVPVVEQVGKSLVDAVNAVKPTALFGYA